MDEYRVFGNPIKQSQSPYIHQTFAKNTNQLLDYQTELVQLSAFDATVNKFIQQGGLGANVTVPFKEQALKLCDQLTPRAQLAGAVNTLSFCRGLILGDNTDGVGLVQDLVRNNVQLKDASILLLGAGGAAKGVTSSLLEQEPRQLHIANRTLSKATNLCAQFSSNKLDAMSFQQTDSGDYDLIINATSASLSGVTPAISDQIIKPDTVCYDMVYAQHLTPFLAWAKQLGAKKTIDGLGMLVSQAAESFYIWRGIEPEVEEVLQQLRSHIFDQQEEK
jgi:shikimate dehydrogenase